MKKTIIVFSLLIIALLILFQLSKFSVLSGDLKIETTIAIVAVIFFFIGVYIHKKSYKKPTPNNEIDKEKIKALEITSREYEVLKHISEGLSNREIGERLFVSESTIKTHVSNLLLKLNAKRRTEALKIAKQLQII